MLCKISGRNSLYCPLLITGNHTQSIFNIGQFSVLIFLALEAISNCRRQNWGEKLLHHFVYQPFDCFLWSCRIAPLFSVLFSFEWQICSHFIQRISSTIREVCPHIPHKNLLFFHSSPTVMPIATPSEVGVSTPAPPSKPQLWMAAF